MNDNSYRLVLSCMPDGINEEMFEFDVVSDSDVTASIEVSEHPMIDGSPIADHMYRNPDNVSVNGMFSLNGNKRTTYSGPYDRLTNIQSFFESLMNEGVFCTLTKLSSNDNTTTMFKQRKNMLLRSITWTEGQNSLGFSFSFKETLLASVVEQIPTKDVTDPNLPDITSPDSTSFSSALIDENEIMEAAIKALTDNGLIAQEFLNGFAKTAGSAAITAAVGFTGTLIAVATICAGTASVVPVGTIIAAAVGVVAGIAAGIYALFKHLDRKRYKVAPFNDVEKDSDRFIAFMEEIMNEVGKLDEHCTVYKLNQNKPQECCLYIDGDNYLFSFLKNIDGTYNLDVENVSNSIKKSWPKLVGPSSIYDCSDENMLFLTENGQEVYVINNVAYNLNKTGASEAEQTEAAKDLSNYLVLVSDIKMKDFKNVVNDIIVNYLG